MENEAAYYKRHPELLSVGSQTDACLDGLTNATDWANTPIYSMVTQD